MKKTIHLLMFALLLPLFHACKPGGEPEPEPDTNNKAMLRLNFNALFGTTPLTFGTMDFAKPDGEQMQFDQFKLLMSEFALIKADNTRVPYGDGYVYVDFKSGRIQSPFAEIPEGDYKGISFVVGLDSATNHGDPSIWPMDHALSPVENGLHWGWAGGYIFSMLDGNYMRSGATTPSAFSFHMATMRYVRTYTIDHNFSISAKKHTMHIDVNALEYFTNPHSINFVNDGAMSHSTGSERGLMDKIFSNMENFAAVKGVSN
jgi:hypothetical protein